MLRQPQDTVYSITGTNRFTFHLNKVFEHCTSVSVLCGWDHDPRTHLLREVKAAYSMRWVEPAAVTVLGVSSTKIMCGLDRELFSFSWTTFSLNVICCSEFLRCRYQPITPSCSGPTQNSRVSTDKHNNPMTSLVKFYLLVVCQEFLHGVHVHVSHAAVEPTNTDKHQHQDPWDHSRTFQAPRIQHVIV